MIIYLDVVIFENFIVNMFLIYVTSQTVHVKLGTKNLVEASLVGSLYVLTIIYPTLYLFSLLPFKILAAVFMIFIAFRKKEVMFNIKTSGIFILYSMVLAGLCIFIEFCDKSSIGTTPYISDFSYKKLIICIMASYVIIHRLVVYVSDRKNINTLIFTVDIHFKDVSRQVKAFLDTGNELREPISNLPVMIVERNLFPHIENCDKIYIPYKLVDGTYGKFEGIKPEYIGVHINDKVKMKQAVIALCDKKLSGLGDYKALLSRGIIY